MTCEDVRELLDDCVDGELGAAEAAAVRGHLLGCDECREQERALRSLLAEAGALAREMQPARDLWPGIAARLRPRRLSDPRAASSVVPFRTRIAVWLPAALAAAAAVVVALSSPTGWRGERQPQAALGPAPIAATSPATLVNAGVSAGSGSLLEAEREYARAASQLLAAIDARRSTLPPETLAAVDENMRVIDQALASLRTALESAPENPELEQLLGATHKRKLDTLRRLARLSKI